MIECKNVEIDQKALFSLKEEEKIESFNFTKRKLTVGQWVDVKDTIDQWLEAQVIDIKDNKVYIHYNGWGTRWDEWISMDSNRIMPFRFHTKQTSIYNYNSPFPNVKPDANVSVYNHNDSNSHQFYDFFYDLNNSFNHCKDIFDKINTNREFLRKYHLNEKNEDLLAKANEKIKKDCMDISDENVNESKIKDRNNNLIHIPDATENMRMELENEEIEKLNKIKQREIFIYSKQVSPFLDRLGRIMTDMGLYIYHNMKNYKLEE
jgi:RNA binding activity-knot of a chromodomain